MKTIRLFLVITLFLPLPGMARLVYAEDPGMSDGPSYVVIKGGLFYPVGRFSIDDFNGPGAASLDMQKGLNGELALGQYSDSGNLASELGIGFFESKGSPSAEPGRARLKAIPVFITWKVLSSPGGGLKPYFEFGLGGYYARLEASGNTGSFSGRSDITYGFHGGAGFNIDLGDAMFVGLEARYVWARPDFGGQHIDLNGIAASINLGFKY